LTVQPIFSRATSTRRARELGQDFMRRQT
jgi:hypothetical protein